MSCTTDFNCYFVISVYPFALTWRPWLPAGVLKLLGLLLSELDPNFSFCLSLVPTPVIFFRVATSLVNFCILAACLVSGFCCLLPTGTMALPCFSLIGAYDWPIK